MEGLRGFAVFLVFVVHYSSLSQAWLRDSGPLLPLLGAAHNIGNVGVDLFFVLSGFLIYGALLDGSKGFGRYFVRRVRRIYPAFLVVFVIYLLASALRPAESKIPSGWADAALYLTQNLLLLPGIFPIEPMITVAWSLSYEMFYYLVAPLVMWAAALKTRSAPWRLAFVVVVSVVAFGAAAWLGGPVRLGMFLAGIVLFELMRNRPGRAPGSAVAFAALLASLWLSLIPLPGAAAQSLRTLLLGVGFALLCWCCFVRGDSLASRLFNWTPMRWLGNMSYSYYLLHGLSLKVFFMALAWVLPSPGVSAMVLWLWLPAFAVTLVPTVLLFLLVERPYSLVVRRDTASGVEVDRGVSDRVGKAVAGHEPRH
jgi:exopolysaccharide production protein ExoZ